MAGFHSDGQAPLRASGNAFMMMLLKHFESKMTLVDCIMATLTFKCTDPRDHLFTLLNLCHSKVRIEPDYNLSVEAMCMHFAVTTLVVDQDLKLLGLAACSNSHETLTDLDLPSWVPNLAAEATLNPLMSYSILPQCFHAGGSDAPLISVSEDQRLLHLKGRIIDSVVATGKTLLEIPMPTAEEILPKSGFPSILKMWKRNWIETCRDVASDGNWPNLSSVKRRIFAETMICGMTGMRVPAPVAVISAVEVLMEYLFDFFTPGYVLTDEVRDLLLIQGALVESSMLTLVSGMRFCKTKAGRFGQARTGTIPGDLICVFLGGEIPQVLRPTGRDIYRLLGECYIQGVMQGETLSDDRYETIDIVLE